MAESVREETLSNNLPNGGHLTKLECAVCLQSCIHPAELPCGHIFCYLCIKGIVNQGRRCAMCRQDIPIDYLDKPRLLNPVDADITSQGFEDGHLWFYEGHNGWWQYDERTSVELESAYQKGERCCDLLIAGFLYVADFDAMLQYRKNDPSRRRRIKRDLATTTKKGIAGLKPLKKCDLSTVNAPEVASNEGQNLPISYSTVLNSTGGIRVNSASNNNSGSADRISGPERLRGIPGGCSLSNCRPATPNDSNVVLETDSSTGYSSNLNLDSAIQDTLDWTIEQIESLNLELLNDYEALFRDVSNYGQLQDSLNQHQFRRFPSNYMSRYLSARNLPNEPPQDDLNSTAAVPDLPDSSNDDANNSPVRIPPVSPEVNPEVETSSDRSLELSDVESPRPPPRNRGSSRSGSAGNSLRHSPSLISNTLLKKFNSSK